MKTVMTSCAGGTFWGAATCASGTAGAAEGATEESRPREGSIGHIETGGTPFTSTSGEGAPFTSGEDTPLTSGEGAPFTPGLRVLATVVGELIVS